LVIGWFPALKTHIKMKTMNDIHEAMQIARNFERVNRCAKLAGNYLMELRSAGGYFMTDEQNKILIAADSIIDKIRNQTGEFDAAKYAMKVLSEEKPAAK
jgi:hypothetical protein